ncbi:MAG TPA: DUF4382 domain-containing protein [Thermoplasmataceae archaeon]|nr:DUF4382 domain-containing protein [Thermoplasmataceae archaeon]
MKGKKIIGGITVAVIILAGIGITYYTSALGNKVQKGDLNVTVADSSNANISGIYIKFTKVAIKDNQSSWETHSLNNQTVNIDVNATHSQDLGAFTMKAGDYNAVKLYMSAVTVSANGKNTTYNLDSRFVQTSHTLRILAHQSTIMLFEFNSSSDLNMSAHTFTPNASIYTSF